MKTLRLFTDVFCRLACRKSKLEETEKDNLHLKEARASVIINRQMTQRDQYEDIEETEMGEVSKGKTIPPRKPFVREVYESVKINTSDRLCTTNNLSNSIGESAGVLTKTDKHTSLNEADIKVIESRVNDKSNLLEEKNDADDGHIYLVLEDDHAGDDCVMEENSYYSSGDIKLHGNISSVCEATNGNTDLHDNNGKDATEPMKVAEVLQSDHTSRVHFDYDRNVPDEDYLDSPSQSAVRIDSTGKINVFASNPTIAESIRSSQIGTFQDATKDRVCENCDVTSKQPLKDFHGGIVEELVEELHDTDTIYGNTSARCWQKLDDCSNGASDLEKLKVHIEVKYNRYENVDLHSSND